MAVESVCAGADKVVSGLGNMLQYGPIGLALAVVLVLFGSLVLIQRQAKEAGTHADALTQMTQLLKYGMGLIIVLFVVSVGATMADKFIDPKKTYDVSFNMDPSRFDRDELSPMLVVSGSGSPISFKYGTGADKVNAQRGYTFSVIGLVNEINRLKELSRVQGLQLSKGSNDDH